MDYNLLVFLVLFVAGTAVLLRSRQERYFVVFMVRTKYFIPLIDFIARLAPGLWKFLADLSVVVSFGGLGAAYLSKYRGLSRNLDYVLFLFGAFVVVFWSQGLLSAVLLLILLLICIKLLADIRMALADYIFASFLITLVFIKFAAIVLAVMGSSVHVPLYIDAVYGGVGIPPLIIGLFIESADKILFAGSNMPGVSPIVPTVRDGQWGVTTPGYADIFVPISIAVIAFAVLLVCHEFAHGVLARVHGIKLKSTGLLTLGIIPIGAFVEPDDKELEKRPSIEKMRVFSAGSFANLIVCAVAALGMVSVSLFLVSSDGAKVVAILPNSSAYGILYNDTVITAINGDPVTGASSYVSVVSNLTVGSMANVTTTNGSFLVPIISNPEVKKEASPYIGLEVANDLRPANGLSIGMLDFLLKTFFWTLLFNFNVALVNVLPIAPFDGWRMLKEILSVFNVSQETSKRIVYAIVSVSLLLIIVNALPLVTIFFDYMRSLL